MASTHITPARPAGRTSAAGWVGPGLPFVGAASYAGLVALVTWQALRGQPLLAPDAATLTGLAVLVAATVAGVVGVLRAHQRTEFASMSL
ncbi:hypothetical protein [Pseudonocardia sp. TRM90224]|uniref:hypothetical protein n=1 Tax=Pseudonocardia sp. TRM90224 TaxID=2812678 RepID=UPI001E4E9786|nr:hypothetical protein [Pseudonocardia sp. TRM90224]